MVKEILFATGNQGKVKELKEAFKQSRIVAMSFCEPRS